MKKITLLLLLCAIVLCGSQCKKTNIEIPVSPTTEQLPPITQTGANTFGCLINGNVWLPKGYIGNFTNSRINIDPSFMDGDLTIRTYRNESGIVQYLSLSSDSIKAVGIYSIKTQSRAKFLFDKYKSDLSIQYCTTDNGNIGGNPNSINGFIKVTRYDLVNKIFSGEFEITFSNNSCGYGDPVKITNGRFDYKL